MKLFLATILVLVLAMARGGIAAEKKYSLPGEKNLRLTLPDGWLDQTDGTTFKLDAPAGKHVSLQMTIVPAEKTLTDDQLRQLALASADQYVGSSVEKRALPDAVKGSAAAGYLCSFTDAAADPGEFRCIASGVVQTGGQLFAVTLLYNEKTSAERAAAVDILKSLSISAGAVPAATILRVSSLDGKWAVLIPGSWQTIADEKSPDGTTRQMTAMESGKRLFTTVFLEPAAKSGDAKIAREFYFDRMKQNPTPMSNVKRSVHGNVAMTEYDQKDADVMAHNVNAYISNNGVWVDVHLSEVEFDEKRDRPELDMLLDGIKLDTTPTK